MPNNNTHFIIKQGTSSVLCRVTFDILALLMVKSHRAQVEPGLSPVLGPIVYQSFNTGMSAVKPVALCGIGTHEDGLVSDL